MRSPSGRVLSNRVDIYVGGSPPPADIAGGMAWVYPATPTYSQVPCTAQPGAIREVVDEQDRITQFVEWRFMFGSFVGVTPRDQLVFQDPPGVVHTVFIEASRDEAGRGSAFTAHGVEKI